MSQNATKEIPDFTDVGDGKQCSSGDCHEMTRPKSNTETGFVPTLDLKLMAQKTRELLFNAMKFDSYQNWGLTVVHNHHQLQASLLVVVA